MGFGMKRGWFINNGLRFRVGVEGRWLRVDSLAITGFLFMVQG